MLETELSYSDWLSSVSAVNYTKNQFNSAKEKLKDLELINQREKVYFRTDKGEAAVLALKARVASEDSGNDDSKSDEVEDIKPVGLSIFKLEFTLRSSPPQKTIAIRFGDWTKGDCVHYRVNVDLDGFESVYDQEGSPCTVQDSSGGIYVSCLNGEHGIEGHTETKAKPGDTLKWCLASLDETCPCGGRHHVRK